MFKKKKKKVTNTQRPALITNGFLLKNKKMWKICKTDQQGNSERNKTLCVLQTDTGDSGDLNKCLLSQNITLSGHSNGAIFLI